jgi:hypothetical protein
VVTDGLRAFDGKAPETLVDHGGDFVAADSIHEGVVDLQGGWRVATAQAGDGAERKVLPFLFAELVLDSGTKLCRSIQVAAEVIAEGDLCPFGSFRQKMRIVRRYGMYVPHWNPPPGRHTMHLLAGDVAEALLHLAQLVVNAV